MKSLKDYLLSILNFLQKEIWRIPLKALPRRKSFLFRQLRMLLIVAKGLREENISSRASALTYFSLLAFVPVLAILFGLFKGFGIEKYLEKLIYANFSFQKEVIDQIVQMAKRALENASGEVVAGIGLVIFLWAVISVLGVIEKTFNDIWQIKKSRKMVRKFSDYFALLLLAPVMMILASSSTVYLTTRISTITGRSEFVEYVGNAVLFFLQLAPYVLLWILLTLLYIVIPNTRVRFKSALVAGIIAGTLFQLVQWIYIRFQIGVSSYNAVYGSFAALPLFLLWLQTSWYIVLLGGEISYANQNIEKFDYEMGHSTISHSYSRLLSLLIAHRVIRNFVEGKKPMIITEIAHALGIPVRIASTLTYELAECGIFSETYTSEYKERAYQPASDINTMTVQSITEILDKKGDDHIPAPIIKEYARLKKVTAAFSRDLNNHPENVLLKDL